MTRNITWTAAEGLEELRKRLGASEAQMAEFMGLSRVASSYQRYGTPNARKDDYLPMQKVRTLLKNLAGKETLDGQRITEAEILKLAGPLGAPHTPSTEAGTSIQADDSSAPAGPQNASSSQLQKKSVTNQEQDGTMLQRTKLSSEEMQQSPGIPVVKIIRAPELPQGYGLVGDENVTLTIPLGIFPAMDDVEPENLICYKIKDDSMAPTLSRGDHIMVDISDTQVGKTGIYMIWMSGVGMIRRLQLRSGNRVRIKPDNDAYDGDEDDVENVTVIGRVTLQARIL